MFKKLDILDEKDKHLRTKSVDASLPLSKDDKKLIQRIIDHLTYSQIEEYEKKYDLRPGMGLAYPQLGINKRIIVIVHEYDDGKFDNYVFVNPKIVSSIIFYGSRFIKYYRIYNPKIDSSSEEMIAAEAGEGCLRVNREVEGHVPRHARVTIEGYDEDGNKIRVRAREDLAIAFQHEIDHLDGILFYDRINKDKPFFTENEMRLI